MASSILEGNKSFEGNVNFKRFMHPSTSESIVYDPVDAEEDCNVFSKFMGCVPFSIPIQMLYHTRQHLAKPISWITNICLMTGIHPDKLTSYSHLQKRFKTLHCKLQNNHTFI